MQGKVTKTVSVVRLCRELGAEAESRTEVRKPSRLCTFSRHRWQSEHLPCIIGKALRSAVQGNVLDTEGRFEDLPCMIGKALSSSVQCGGSEVKGLKSLGPVRATGRAVRGNHRALHLTVLLQLTRTLFICYGRSFIHTSN